MYRRATPTMDKIERRFTLEPFQIRVADGDAGKTTISGRAVVYNAWTQIGSDSWGWMERIAPGALTDSLKDEGIYATFNHDSDNLLGRVSNDTLRMTDGEKALMVEIDPNLDTEIGRQVLAFVQRQDVRGMSFAFSVDKYEIEYAKKKGDMDRITIAKAKLYELGPVTNPAYTQTSAKLRSSEFGAAIDAERARELDWAKRRATILRRTE